MNGLFDAIWNNRKQIQEGMVINYTKALKECTIPNDKDLEQTKIKKLMEEEQVVKHNDSDYYDDGEGHVGKIDKKEDKNVKRAMNNRSLTKALGHCDKCGKDHHNCNCTESKVNEISYDEENHRPIDTSDETPDFDILHNRMKDNSEEDGTPKDELPPEEPGESEAAQEKELPEKEYLGKTDDDTFFYLNHAEDGLNITDAEGKIVYPKAADKQKNDIQSDEPAAGEEPIPDSEELQFIIKAQQELEMTEISADILTRYVQPALDVVSKEREEEEGFEFETPPGEGGAPGEGEEPIPGEEEEETPEEEEAEEMPTGEDEEPEIDSEGKPRKKKKIATGEQPITIESKDSPRVKAAAKKFNSIMKKNKQPTLKDFKKDLGKKKVKEGLQSEIETALDNEKLYLDTDYNFNSETSTISVKNPANIARVKAALSGLFSDVRVGTSESKVNEVKVVFNGHTYDVMLEADMGEGGIHIKINGQGPYHFTAPFVEMFGREKDGSLTEDSIKELGQSALSFMNKEHLEKIALAGVHEELVAETKVQKLHNRLMKIAEALDFMDKVRVAFRKHKESGMERDKALRQALDDASDGTFSKSSPEEQKNQIDKFSKQIEYDKKEEGTIPDDNDNEQTKIKKLMEDEKPDKKEDIDSITKRARELILKGAKMSEDDYNELGYLTGKMSKHMNLGLSSASEKETKECIAECVRVLEAHGVKVNEGLDAVGRIDAFRDAVEALRTSAHHIDQDLIKISNKRLANRFLTFVTNELKNLTSGKAWKMYNAVEAALKAGPEVKDPKAEKHEKELKQAKKDTVESVKEDADPTNPADARVNAFKSDTELASAIRQDIKAEQEAIQLYQTHAESTDNEQAKKLLTDIADEERVHLGELNKLLSFVQPNEGPLHDEGEKEAGDKMGTDETPTDEPAPEPEEKEDMEEAIKPIRPTPKFQKGWPKEVNDEDFWNVRAHHEESINDEEINRKVAPYEGDVEEFEGDLDFTVADKEEALYLKAKLLTIKGVRRVSISHIDMNESKKEEPKDKVINPTFCSKCGKSVKAEELVAGMSKCCNALTSFDAPLDKDEPIGDVNDDPQEEEPVSTEEVDKAVKTKMKETTVEEMLGHLDSHQSKEGTVYEEKF
jgi:rubrerythrin